MLRDPSSLAPSGEPMLAETVDAIDVTGRETVLVVEDEPLIREMAVRAFRRSGYAVIAAADGDEAIEVARSSGRVIDLLVTDIVLPERSGAEVAEWVRLLMPGLRVVFASGLGDETLARHGLDVPGQAVLRKPYTSARLLACARRVLDARPAHSTRETPLTRA